MPLAQIAKYESGKSQYEEKTDRDCVKFPPLRERIASMCLKHMSNAKYHRIKYRNFDQAQPERLDIPSYGNKRKQAFAEKRQVGG